MRTLLFSVALLAGSVAAAAAQQTITLAAGDKPIAISLTPVFAIGAPEGEVWEMFAEASSVAFDAQDNLYVLDQMDGRVVVFDARGKYLRNIGRPGPGPGEMQMPNALAVLRDGSVVVSDLSRKAFSIWDRTGKFVRSVPYGDMTGTPTLNGLAVGGDQLLVRQHARRADEQPDGKLPFMRFDPATGKGTVALRVEPPIDGEETRVESRGNTMTMRLPAVPTFSPTPLMAGLSDGTLAVSYAFDYTVRLAGKTGERVIRRAVASRKVTAADRERILKVRRETLERDGQVTYSFRGGNSTKSSKKLTPAEINQRLKAIEFATTMPAIRGLLVDGRDNLWISRSPQSGKATSPVDVVRADGTYVGTIPDLAFPIAVSASGLAAYIEMHPDGYQQVIVKRIRV